MVETKDTLLDELDPEQKLLYNIIFSDKTSYEIPYMEYITEMKYLESFTNDILDKLVDAKIEISEQAHILTDDQKVWILRIKR